MNIQIILSAIKALATVAPIVIREGHGERVTDVLNTIHTLGERGVEGYEDLKLLAAKLEQMDGVDRQAKEDLWAEITSTHNAIQEAAKLIPKDPPADPPAPPEGGETGGETGSGDAGGSGEEEKT